MSTAIIKRRKRKRNERLFRGMPVREARAAIHVQPNQKDIDGATKEDPENCAYARCLKRVLGSANVFVYKYVAYVQTLDESGNPIMERYIVRKYANEYLLKFDHGEKVAPGGFVFHRPAKSRTLKYLAKQSRDARARGVISPRTSKGKSPKVKEFSLRTGTGKVHLFGSEDQIKGILK